MPKAFGDAAAKFAGNRRFLGWLAVPMLVIGFAAPAAHAADEDEPFDARLNGFAKPVLVDGGSTASSWLAMCGLGIICFGVLFKDAKRSHLD